MSKKDFSAVDALVNKAGQRKKTSKEEPIREEPTRKKSKSKQGLPEGLTRATFIVKDEYLEHLKGYAFYEGLSLKDAVDKMLGEWLADKPTVQRKK